MAAAVAPEPIRLPELLPTQRRVLETYQKALPGSLTLIGFGGSFGGSKTASIVFMALAHARAFPGSRILIGRAELTTLKTTTMEEFFKWCPPTLIPPNGRHRTENWVKIRERSWPKGIESVVYFRGLDDEEKFGSEEFDAVFIDEASGITVRAARMLIGRLRHKLPEQIERTLRNTCSRCDLWLNIRPEDDPKRVLCPRCGLYCHGCATPRLLENATAFCPDCGERPKSTFGNGLKYLFMAASNPYPGWFEEWFYRGKFQEALEGLPPGMATVKFVPSKVSDNIHLPPHYEASLRAIYDENTVQRFLDGRFDAFTGQVFDNFFPETHRYLGPLPKEGDYSRVVGGLDFGGMRTDSHFSAGIVSLVLNSGRIMHVAEFKDRGPDVDARQAMWMLAQEARWCNKHTNMRVHWCADRSQTLGIQQWRRMGFNISPSLGGKDSLRNNVMMVKRRLDKDAAGIPGTFYLPELKAYEHEMLNYAWPETTSEDGPADPRPVKKNDDIIAAVRYEAELLEKPLGDPQQLWGHQIATVA